MVLDSQILEKEEGGKLVLNKVPPLDPQGTYLMEDNYVASADTYFLGQEKIKRNQVESISVTYTKKVPSKAIHSWDVSAVQDESIMAWYIDKDNNNLYELYIGEEGGVKSNPNSSWLFYKFNNVKAIDLKYLYTSDVTYMRDIFSGCSSLTSLDLSSFDISQVTDMSKMFVECRSLTAIDMRKATFTSVTGYNNMFVNSLKLTTVNVKDTDAQTFINARLADANKTGVTVTIAA